MKKVYKITEIDCAVCAGKVEQELKKLKELKNVSYNFPAQKLFFEYDDNLDQKEIFHLISKTVKTLEPQAVIQDTEAKKQDAIETKKHIFSLDNFIKLIGLVFLIVWFAFELSGFLDGIYLIIGYLIAYLMISYNVLYKFFKNLFRLRLFDENFLMTIATIGAFILGEYFEGVTIMLFYQIGEFLQDLAVNKSRDHIKSLIGNHEHVITFFDQNNNTQTTHPDNIKVGDKILLKAGEMAALDGVVVEGTSTLDTSSLTGESLPKTVIPGDEILSGSINLQNSLTVSVTRLYKESTASKIMELVEKASSKKSKSEQFITKFSRVYTPVVVGIALIIGLIIPHIMQMNASMWGTWAKTALTFLIVSCPCALVLSIPVSYFCGIGAASRNGVLFKGTDYLEKLSQIDTFIFDKTGTLTTGVFEVSQIIPSKNYSQDDVITTAAYAESYSSHPLARAVMRKVNQNIDLSKISEHKSFVGLGVKAVIDNHIHFAGNYDFLVNNGVTPDQKLNGSVIYVAKDNKYIGAVLLQDTVKPEAKESIKELKNLGIKQTVMVTGDNAEVALRVSDLTGLDEYHAQCLPEDKLNIVEGYIEKGKKTAFVGEGINDVLAISRADIGISMGALGSDVSMESSDMVIMTDELSKLPQMISLSKYTKFIVLLNIILVLAVKLTIMFINFIPQLQSLLLAELADVGIALVAVMIAQTILKFGKKKIKIQKEKHN
ncbi:MAG TPA: heavy metal translocating P-type ATPase [Clostridia bacterium]